jgi:predicted nucleic acid-binding protein
VQAKQHRSPPVQSQAEAPRLPKKLPRELAGRICRTLLKRSEGNLARIDAALAEHAMKLAAEHQLTAYDAAYVAAARKHAWTLVSADVKELVRPGLALAPDDRRLAGEQEPEQPDA